MPQITRLVRRRVAVSDDIQGIGASGIESVAHREVFAQADVLAFECRFHQMRIALDDAQRIKLALRVKIANGVAGAQFKVDDQATGNLRAVCGGAQRQRKFGAQILDRHALVVADLEALGSERRNGHDARAEDVAAHGFAGLALALLEQAGIDGLPAQAVVDLFGAPAFDDDARDAGHVIPDGEIGDQAARRQRENIVAFEHVAGVVAEDLPYRNAGVAIIDEDVHDHLIEGEHGRIGLVVAFGEEHAAIGGAWQHRQQEQGTASHGRLRSDTRTRPLSVPT